MAHEPGHKHPLWANVTELAEAVMTASAPPAGFTRRELSIGGASADVYAGITHRKGAGPATVVVVIAPPESGRPTISEIRRRFDLTPREAEVALLLAERLSNKEIARDLRISPRTASRHTESVFVKLNTNSRREVGTLLRRRRPAHGARKRQPGRVARAG